MPGSIISSCSEPKVNIGNLTKLLKFKIGPKVILAVNVDIQDHLINGQTGNIRHIQFAQVSVLKVYVVKFLINKPA